MTQSGQGGDSRQPQPHPGPQPPVYEAPAYEPPAYEPPAYEAPAYGAPAYGVPAPGAPAYGYPPQDAPPGHVLGPGYEGPGAPHGYGYPPIPEAETQYIPPVPAHPGPMEAQTQYIPPVSAAPAHMEAATQYIPPVPAGPGPMDAAPMGAAHMEAATQYIPPVPAGPGGGPGGMHEAATQYIPPVPAGPGPGQGQSPGQGPPDVFDGLFRGDDQGHTQVLPPIQEPVRSQAPPPAPPFQQRRPKPQPQFPQQPAHLQQTAGFQQPPPPPQFQQPGPFQQPPPEEPARKVSPVVIGVAVLALAVAGLGVGSLLGDGKAQNNDPAAVDTVPSKPAGSGSAKPPADEAPVDPARAQAVQLDKVLADSNDSRATVIRAVDDVKACKNLAQSAEDLRDAARKREELVTKLQELKTDKLPDHAKLTAALTKAWQSSGSADQHYAAWADEAAGDRKTCKDGKGAKATTQANEGNKASAEATKAKDSAAGMWNKIAAQYGLTQRDTSQL
ncbi:hypothetical protein OHS33_20410 [Streptomyces sp. NBC_00536]|uniref:hypothetical protein n=1 Tax=Streptomyces sp. NBC_00536 TaxID=2975769 RepID=UPI002E808DCF|nr:hypothetical protein [Streptomyces sp. NBC_00536]WUC80478.1 hypothetical protein OHS33_20410 [Streptomyces sp. NBC_00536]